MDKLLADWLDDVTPVVKNGTCNNQIDIGFGEEKSNNTKGNDMKKSCVLDVKKS